MGRSVSALVGSVDQNHHLTTNTHCSNSCTSSMAKTSPTVRGRIVELHELGLSSRQIAKKYHCSHSTVLDILRRYNQTGSCRNRPKPGRPRALSPSTTHHDYMLIRRGKVHNATDLQRQFHPELSARTVQRELRRAGLRACVPRKVPFLTHQHKQVRLVFARHTREWGPCHARA